MKYKSYLNNDSDNFVILYHGWAGNVDNNFELVQSILELGFNVILPEIIYHDSREPITNYFDNEIMNRYFWKTIFTTINEFNQLISKLQISPESITVIGISMGGFIASGILKNFKQLKGMICINGSGSFLKSEINFREINKRKILNDKEIKLLNSFDPIIDIPYDNNILILHGEADKIVPIDGAIHFYSEQILKGANNTQINKYPGINHTVNKTMIRDIVKWLSYLNKN